MANRAKITFDLVSLTPEVTGSCLKLKYNIPNEKPIQILLDKGYYQEAKYSSLNIQKDVDFSDIDYVFLSHNHIDHSGLLPILYKNGYKHKVYCTYQTSKVLPIALNNTVQIMETESKLFKVKPLYSFDDVTKMMSHIVRVNYNEVIRINKNLSVMFIQNSHLYGAASIYISVKAPNQETNNLLYVSDYAEKSPIFKSLKFPSWLYDKKINIIQESTYGATKEEDVENVFRENIKLACKSRKSILLPSFAMGRYQEVMYFINLYKYYGDIPKNYTVYLDGSISDAYNKILFNSDFLDRNAKEILLKYPFHKVGKNREYLLNNPNRCIVITTSGMVTNGYSKDYVTRWLNRNDILIHLLSSYMADNSLGKELIETTPGDIIKIQDSCIKKVADVKCTGEFSRHATQSGNIEYLKKFNNIECLFITHGSTENRIAYKHAVDATLNLKRTEILETGKTYRVGAYGLNKIF